jgi:hypothetical protein
VNTYISPYTEINSKWIKDLNVRSQLSNYLKETDQAIGMGKDNWYGIRPQKPKIRNKSQNTEMDFIKLTSFCQTEETIN